jgi:hypothetical protein
MTCVIGRAPSLTPQKRHPTRSWNKTIDCFTDGSLISQPMPKPDHSKQWLVARIRFGRWRLWRSCLDGPTTHRPDLDSAMLEGDPVEHETDSCPLTKPFSLNRDWPHDFPCCIMTSCISPTSYRWRGVWTRPGKNLTGIDICFQRHLVVQNRRSSWYWVKCQTLLVQAYYYGTLKCGPVKLTYAYVLPSTETGLVYIFSSASTLAEQRRLNYRVQINACFHISSPMAKRQKQPWRNTKRSMIFQLPQCKRLTTDSFSVHISLMRNKKQVWKIPSLGSTTEAETDPHPRSSFYLAWSFIRYPRVLIPSIIRTGIGIRTCRKIRGRDLPVFTLR